MLYDKIYGVMVDLYLISTSQLVNNLRYISSLLSKLQNLHNAGQKTWLFSFQMVGQLKLSHGIVNTFIYGCCNISMHPATQQTISDLFQICSMTVNFTLMQ